MHPIKSVFLTLIIVPVFSLHAQRHDLYESELARRARLGSLLGANIGLSTVLFRDVVVARDGSHLGFYAAAATAGAVFGAYAGASDQAGLEAAGEGALIGGAVGGLAFAVWDLLAPRANVPRIAFGGVGVLVGTAIGSILGAALVTQPTVEPDVHRLQLTYVAAMRF